MNLSDKDIDEIHRGSRTKLSYNLAWTRTYLKKYGIIENSKRGVWSLTPKGNREQNVNVKDVVKTYKDLKGEQKIEASLDEIDAETEITWRDRLLDILKALEPSSFEKLCQRVLRESGFQNVEVTGRSGDGGIDGKGVIKISGLLSFTVFFQCKRYKRSSVSAKDVRDFRGAMSGRADKGLIITTSTFTRDAKKEAKRDGAELVDLIDGEELVEKLKELSIGIEIKERVVEEVIIIKEWFENI